MNILKYIFFPSWVTIDVMRGVWNMSINGVPDGKEYCFYEIQYSKVRNKYKIKTSGYRPKYHPMKAAALEQLVRYNKTII